MLKLIRQQLLKVPSIKRAVEDYRKRMKEQKRAERWAYLIHECQLYHSRRGQALADRLHRHHDTTVRRGRTNQRSC